MAEVQYERSVGTGEQLPQGAAADLNEQAASTPQEPGVSGGDLGIPSPDLLAEGEGPDFHPTSDEDQILFGPSQGEGQDMPSQPSINGRVPNSLVRRLPALARAAQAPGAPPAVIALYKLTLQRLENEIRNGG